MLASDRDTIVAISTAPGEGAIGIVRLSGPQAIGIAAQCFQSRVSLGQIPERTVSYGRFVSSGQDLDEVLACVMRGPRSFTGEDTVELSCHGGPYLLQRVVDALVERGARMALRGEFTKRAFLNGKLDLSQAEAVADMIAARSDLSLRSAFFQLRGGLGERFKAMAETLRESLAFLEADLDFSEDVGIDLQAVEVMVRQAAQEIDRLLASYRQGKVLRQGALVMLAGRPNVGKSSLLNRLLEEDRAIVTDIPGTTRDTIHEAVDLDGLLVTLVDSAGIRETTDPIEREGTRRSLQVMDQASLVLYMVDGSRAICQDDRRFLSERLGSIGLLVLNKVDLGLHNAWSDFGCGPERVLVSAKTGQGLPELRSQIRHILLGADRVSVESVTRERHFAALSHARRAIEGAVQSLGAGLPGELVAIDLREALVSLSEIIGETTADDILSRIFSTFCIGK